jgi:predicted dehydrogenase
MTKSLNVGLIGCGNISPIYLENSAWLETINIIAVADLLPEAARKRAAEYDVPQALGVDELLATPEIDIVLNLTTPNAHAEVAMEALRACKSVYNEKPLSIDRDDGLEMLKLAEANGLRIGCAPDTFLGAAHQTCRGLIDAGVIGQPVAATAFMMSFGPESWHPNPFFFFQPGAGPMFDMGPYYLTALINLFGPVVRVAGMTATGREQRLITSQPHLGTNIDVEIPTHVTGLLEFENGAVATLITSFDVPASRLMNIEVYGTEGSLSVPDPNTFGGSVQVKKAGESAWTEITHTHAHPDNSRGLGLADMAAAILDDRAHRANGDMAFHVLDLMHSFHEAADAGKHMDIASSCRRPAALDPLPQISEPQDME